jgi:hypothetical protein
MIDPAPAGDRYDTAPVTPRHGARSRTGPGHPQLDEYYRGDSRPALPCRHMHWTRQSQSEYEIRAGQFDGGPNAASGGADTFCQRNWRSRRLRLSREPQAAETRLRLITNHASLLSSHPIDRCHAVFFSLTALPMRSANGRLRRRAMRRFAAATCNSVDFSDLRRLWCPRISQRPAKLLTAGLTEAMTVPE